MGLLEQTINELRQLDSNVMLANEMELEKIKVSAVLKGQAIKAAGMIIKINSNALNPEQALERFENINMVGSGSVLQIEDLKRDVVVCMVKKGKIIARVECEEHSGTTGNMSKCQKCPNFSVTRQILHDSDDATKDRGL